jgi:hypothetical protein
MRHVARHRKLIEGKGPERLRSGDYLDCRPEVVELASRGMAFANDDEDVLPENSADLEDALNKNPV